MHEVLQQKRPLHVKADASGVGLGTGLLHVRGGMNCHVMMHNTTCYIPSIWQQKPIKHRSQIQQAPSRDKHLVYYID